MKLIVVLLVAAVAAAGGAAEELAKRFEQALERGALESMLDAVPDYIWGGLSDDPEALYRIAGASAKFAPKDAVTKPDTWKRLAELLEKACGNIPKNVRGKAAAQAAIGATRLCRAQVNLAAGEKFDAQIWREAADHFLSAHAKKPGESAYLERAARILNLAARIGADPAMKAEGLNLCLDGAKSYPRNEYFAQVHHAAELNRIEETAKKKRSEAKRMLQDYLSALESGKYGTGTPRDTAHTRAVTFARLHKKLGVKPKYRTTSVSIGTVWMEIPKGKQWEKIGLRINQYDEEGTLVRVIRTDSYRWDTNYFLGPKMFGGSSTKGLARIGETDVLTVVTEVSHRKKVGRTKLSRKINSTVGFEIGGLDKDGDYICFRWFYFKSAKKKHTSLKVGIVEYVEAKQLDPESKFVVSTLREGR